MIKIEVDEGYAIDMYAIKDVKFQLSPSSESESGLSLFRKQLLEQFGEEKFYKLISSQEYKNLLATNRDIYNSINDMKKGFVGADFVDYLNWVRYYWKVKINKNLSAEQAEIKIGYDWNALEIKNHHLVVLLDSEDVITFSKKNITLERGYPHFQRQSVHRIVAKAKFGNIDNFLIDHVNKNKYDCRRKNLRICTPSQNSHNRGLSKRNKSGYIGVVKHKNGSFVAQIAYGKKSKCIGYFDTMEEAAIARDIYAFEHAGEFATLNIPNPSQELKDKVIAKLKLRKMRRKNATSKFYGVRAYGKSGKWLAYYWKDKKIHRIGVYEKEIDAAKAVDEKSRQLGKFKRLNFNNKLNISI